MMIKLTEQEARLIHTVLELKWSELMATAEVQGFSEEECDKIMDKLLGYSDSPHQPRRRKDE